MSFQFNTGAERIAVLEDLRKPVIIFPPNLGLQSHGKNIVRQFL
jgi:hypothetical protein